MKKIITASFVFAFLFMTQNAIASSVWNGASNDCPGIAIANQTTNVGIIVPCWPLKTVSANDGDSVNIRFYYHNTSGQNATNVKFILNASTGASSSHNFSGQIISDQGNLSLGSVTVNTPSGSTVDFSSAHWLPNQRQTESPMPFGQSSKGTEILGGGLNIGTVASSWDTQGSVVVAFSVNSPVNPPANVPTGTLTPNTPSCSISVGQSSCDINFSWNTSNPVGTSAITRDGGSTVATGNSGSKALTVPYNSATFRLYNNALQLDSKTVTSYCTSGSSWNGSVCTQNVNPTDSCTITNFTVGGALSSTVTLGNGVDLAWTTTGCNYVNIPNVGTNLSANGSKTVYPATSTSYTLTGVGSSGSSSPRTVSVTVNQGSNPSYNCSISSFTIGGALSDTVSIGDSTDLSWSTTGCNYVTISNVGSSLSPNDSYTIYPSTSTTYRLTGYGSSGTNPTRTVTVTVNPIANPTYACSISNFTANSSLNTTVTVNDPVYISWDTTNCTSINITGVGSSLSSSGSYTVYPSRNTRYTISARGSSGGTQTRYVDVTVNQDRAPVYYNNNYNYNYNDNNDCVISDFSVDSSYITAGGSVRLNWNTNNCRNISIPGITGYIYSSGNRLLYPTSNITYTIYAYGNNGGVQTRSVYVNVNPYIIPTPIPVPVYNKCAVTTVATNINQTSAQLNGIVTGTSGANTYFEYGTSVNLGSRTISRYVNSNTNFSDTISGLSPNTIYYFRMVSDCNNGSSLGSIEIFRTIATQTTNVITRVITQGTTVVGTASPVELEITNRYQGISEGDLIDYTVTYKNIGKVKLLRPMIQVVLPTNVTLVNSSRGTYSIDTHTLSAQIEDLNAGENGVMYLQGKVDSIPLNNSQIPTTAILIYTTPNGSQENAMAYVINIPRLVMATGTDNGNVLGSSAFFVGISSIGFIGWLIIILIILLIILISRTVYRGNSNQSVTHNPTH